MKTCKLFSALLISLFIFSAHADDWIFELEPYVMATKIVGDASIGRASGAKIDVNFETVFNNLDMAGMLHFEAHHKSGWGLAMDYAFMDLSAKKVNDRDGFVNVSLRQGVLETLGLYRVNYGNATVDYFAGVRWWDNDMQLALDPAVTTGSTDIKVQEGWVDVVAGIRWNKPINKSWHFIARGDVGGFGLSADFTSTIEAGVTYKISQLMTLDMKYKASWVDYDNDATFGTVGHFVYDTVTHGPILGLNFSF